MTPRNPRTCSSVETGESVYAPVAEPDSGLLKVTAEVPLMTPVAAIVVAVLSVMEPAPTLVMTVPAGMPVPETGMPTRKPVVLASGTTVPAAVWAACAAGAANTAEIVVAADRPAPATD